VLAQLFPIVVVLHVAFAISLLVPTVILPFTVRRRGRKEMVASEPGRVASRLIWLQRNGTFVIGGGLAVTGLLLVATLGAQVLSQPWLLLALLLYAADLLLAFFVQRPGVLRLLRVPIEDTPETRQRLTGLARRQRYVSYAMAGLVGVIAFLMMTKPQL
jgi:hypothetical protein